MDLFDEKVVLLVGFSTLGYCKLKDKVNTRTYVSNPSIQPSRECLVIYWKVNSRYGSHYL